MSRVIKFRAWNKWIKKMIHPCNGDFIRWHAMSNWEECLDVMQFTGLTDKNGVDIYDGDILRVLMTDWASKSDSDPRTLEQYKIDKSEIYVTGFHKGSFTMFFGNSEGYHHYIECGTHGEIEILGNIYESPELLND